MTVGHEAYGTEESSVIGDTARNDHLDGEIYTWAGEYLSGSDHETFVSAYDEGRFADAHAVLMQYAFRHPWRCDQWDQWLADHAA